MAKGARNDRWLLLIGAAKLFKGLLLLGLAIGALKLVNRNLVDELTRWAGLIHVDPENRYLQMLLSKVSGLDPRKLSALGIGTFCYSGLFLTEGVGLLFKKRWAEYLTAIATSSFIPLEIYELFKKFEPARLVLLFANVAIAAYLFWRLKTDRPKTGKGTGARADRS